MFSGQYSTSINSNNQVTLPKQFRAQLAQGAVITQGFDKNLMVLPNQAFHDLSERIMRMNLTDPITRGLLRMMLGNASEISLNEAGQIEIPEKLWKIVDLQCSTVMVGLGDFFEIWSTRSWSDQETVLTNNEADPSRYSSLSLSMR
jgi:MraZ protein